MLIYSINFSHSLRTSYQSISSEWTKTFSCRSIFSMKLSNCHPERGTFGTLQKIIILSASKKSTAKNTPTRAKPFPYCAPKQNVPIYSYICDATLRCHYFCHTKPWVKPLIRFPRTGRVVAWFLACTAVAKYMFAGILKSSEINKKLKLQSCVNIANVKLY